MLVATEKRLGKIEVVVRKDGAVWNGVGGRRRLRRWRSRVGKTRQLFFQCVAEVIVVESVPVVCQSLRNVLNRIGALFITIERFRTNFSPATRHRIAIESRTRCSVPC